MVSRSGNTTDDMFVMDKQVYIAILTISLKV